MSPELALTVGFLRCSDTAAIGTQEARRSRPGRSAYWGLAEIKQGRRFRAGKKRVTISMTARRTSEMTSLLKLLICLYDSVSPSRALGHRENICAQLRSEEGGRTAPKARQFHRPKIRSLLVWHAADAELSSAESGGDCRRFARQSSTLVLRYFRRAGCW
jgi:hypothetical protein